MPTQTTTVETDTAAEELESALAAAAAAAGPFAALPPKERADMLAAMAEGLEAAAGELVPIAMSESGLPEARLRGELTRTATQLRMFVEVLADGHYAGVVVDRADPDFVLGPRPELRRAKFGIGPVLVFAASNFPFAFSVAGGDTASALAAGCPVVLKAHPGHPELSARTGRIVTEALRGVGAPEGTFAVVFGVDTGIAALRDPRIAAAAFTGSVPAGRALGDIAASRPVPIPFYGELGSINPAIATPAAIAARGPEIAAGYVGSFTLGAGQFCTSPGLFFLPAGHGLEGALADGAAAVPDARMLTDGVHAGYVTRRAEIVAAPGVRILAEGGTADGLAVAPTLVATDTGALLEHPDELLDEVFGPLSIVVEYSDVEDLMTVVDQLPGSLTATLHTGPDDGAELVPLVQALRSRVGRLLFNGWPTGVTVSPAMHHGGPYPSTTASLHTSVGATAIERFLRPVVYQDAPEALLPAELREDNPLGLPRTVNAAGESSRWGR